MALKNFAVGEDAIDSNFNAGIDDIPGTYPLVISSRTFGGKTGTAKRLVESFRLEPVIGDNIVIACLPWATSGTGEVWFELVSGGATVTLWNFTFTNGAAATAASSAIVDLTALSDPPGDVTGTDVTLNLYMDPEARLKNLRIWTGDSATLADYGL